MFDLLLHYHKWKFSLKAWVISKLNRRETIEEEIYNDILNTFAYKTEGYYKIYMRDAPLEFMDIETMIQERRNNYVAVNDVDLNHIYNITLDYIADKMVWYPKVKVIPYNENGMKWFEVYYKNYKQIK